MTVMLRKGEGSANGDGSGWDRGFWRMVRYASVLLPAAWFAFSLKSDVKQLSVDMQLLRGEVRSLAARTFTREEAERILREANEEFARNAALHRISFRPFRLYGTRGTGDPP